MKIVLLQTLMVQYILVAVGRNFLLRHFRPRCIENKTGWKAVYLQSNCGKRNQELSSICKRRKEIPTIQILLAFL